MYAQSYQDEITRAIPDTYSGTALRDSINVEREIDEPCDVPASKNPWESQCDDKQEKRDGNWLEGLLSSIAAPFGFGKGASSNRIKLGTEELMIIGVAAFLFFSKERDIECIIMLIALLLIA